MDVIYALHVDTVLSRVYLETFALSSCQKRPQAVKIYPRASNGTRLVHYFVSEMDPSSGKWHLVRTAE